MMIRDGEFRSALYFRLRGIEIVLPPLRERLEDLDALIHHFVSIYSKSYNKKVSVSSEAVRALKDYSWPGNIRELRNVIETAVLLADDHSLLVSAQFRLENSGTEMPDEDKYIDDGIALGRVSLGIFNSEKAFRR